MALEGWEYILAYTCIGLLLVFSIYYFNKSKKTDEAMGTLKKLNFALGILFLFIFLSRMIDLPIADMVNPEDPADLFGIDLSNQGLYDIFKYLTYDNVLFIEDFGVGPVDVKNWLAVNTLFLIGLAVAVFYMERAFIPKARHVFFILLVITIVMSVISGFFPILGTTIDIFEAETDDIRLIFAILGYLSFAVIPIIYFIVAGKTTGTLRRNALLLAFGFILILVDIHTVGHNSGGWERSVPCLLGFILLAAGNKSD